MSNISQYYESLCEVHRPLFVCNSETELVVEGFPRSANTFFVDFLHLNNQTKVAHHTHDARNVILGFELEKPVILLIRKPVDAISSFMIFSRQSLDFAAKEYLGFYSSIISHPRKSYIVAQFDEVVSDPNRIIDAVNSKFDLNLARSSSVLEDIDRAKQLDFERARSSRTDEEFIRTVAVPNEERKKIKEHIIDSVNEYCNLNSQINNVYLEIINN